MEILKPTARKTAAANQNPTEREYWLEELSGLINKSAFAADFTIPLAGAGASEKRETAAFTWAGTIFDNLMKLGGDVDQKVHLILTAGVTALLGRLTDSGDIIVGTPIYKQEGSGSLLNTLLAVRNRLFGDMTFKELLLKVRKTMVEAIQHQNYPIEVLIRQLELPARENENEFPLFDVIVMLENLQPRDYISPVEPFMSMIFSFKKTGSAMDLEISYRATRYEADTVKRIGNYLTRFMDTALAEPGTKLEVIEILSEEEKKKLLFDFNDTEVDYPVGKTIHRWFEEQAAKTPDNLAVSGKFKNEAGGETTYKELNENANRLARLLKANGVEKESVVGLMMERSIDSVCGLLAILKTGGTYLPIDTGLPGERVRYMLEDSGAQILLSNSHAVDEISFTALRNFDSTPDVQLVMTQHREPIEAFDKLPMADRSLVDLQNYKSKIGMAGVTDAVSMQTTRGCPYECLFCHKVWSKTHTFRSAENIFSEVEYYYKKGVRNFSILDDCFNLNKKNSELFFRMIVEKEMEIRIYFPNGMRGDILTEDYIDLMVQAGTVNVNLSLETASPRLQKLVKKNL
ncbi:MAG: AMP-binding protein, partial [bacterium]|nr:AMP-binding protein [bacterium]